MNQLANSLDDVGYRDELYNYVQRLKPAYISTLNNYDETDQYLLINLSKAKYNELAQTLIEYGIYRTKLKEDYFDQQYKTTQLLDSSEIIYYSLIGLLAVFTTLFPVRLFIYAMRWSIKTLRK